MGKGRFTALDVSAMTTSLQQLIIGTRIANIYDLNSRTYLIKFSGKDKRLFLIMESGIRFHCTSFMRELSSMPNHFCSKLRKYLKSKKLSSIEQIGRDRIVIFTFGVQETKKFYLILELFAGGNIILCDHEHNIIICLRVHQNIKHGEKYPLFDKKDKNNRIDNEEEIGKGLRNCAARLIKQNYAAQHNTNTTKKKLSNRQKRKQRMNQKMETIRDFIVKNMSASPIIIDSIMHKYKINNKESLLEYVCKPHPVFKTKTEQERDETRENENDESDSEEENEPESDEDEEYEDAMYANMNEEQKINAMILNSEKFDILMQCFVEYETLIESLQLNVCKGFIISKRISLLPMKKINIFVKKQRRKQVKPTINLEDDDVDEEKKDNKNDEKNEKKEEVKFIYDEFIPFEVSANDMIFKNKQVRIDNWTTFNQCVDEFYSSNEAAKSDQKQTRAETLALKKLETAKGQHETRVSKLQKQAENNAFYASVIEENLELVDKAITGVNTLLAQGIDWNDLGNRIREETQFGNPIAALITTLRLHEGIITLKLKHTVEIYAEKGDGAVINMEESDDEQKDDDDSGSDISDMFDNDVPTINYEEPVEIKTEEYKINIELRLSAWNNARKYYAMKKQLLDKKEKTLEATNKALKAAQNKMKTAMKEATQTAQIQKLRKTYWFEKFYWFISSDNFLVIAGRDAQQNEIIVKKYMDKQRDIYVHALIHGASSVIIKNPKGLKTLPPRTINEAGAMCVCRSRAWQNNVSTESYWVYGHQVSKTPQTGQYLPTGSFVIRGKRNFITQQQLQMAIVLLFKIDEKSYELNHTNERKINYFNHDENVDQVMEKNKKIGDVTGQFILGDIDVDDDEDDTVKKGKGKQKKKKKKKEENAIYITRTMIHSNPKQKKEFEEQRRKQKLKDKQGDNDDNNNEQNEIKIEKKGKVKKNKTDKKLAKYGFDKNKQTVLSKKEKNKRKKRAKYNKKYDESDRKLVQQLLGIKPEHLNKNKDKNDENDEEKKKQEELKKNEPKEGYELNENPMNLNKNQEENMEEIKNEPKEEKQEDAYDKQRKFALTNRLEDELKLLTGKLYETDTVLYCMVMTAPYSAIIHKNDYEYKIKIQPGTTKRGKAVKYVNELFKNMCKASVLNEKLDILSLCKAIKETEINHIFLSNVKISGPGVKNLKLQHKIQQKKMQKEKWKDKQKQFEKQQKQSKQYNPSTNPKKRKKRK